MLRKEEIRILRELACAYAQAAAQPAQQEKKRLWLKLNHLHMERPMLTIHQLPWNELDVDGSLVCRVEDPYWRGVEESLRQTLYQLRHLPADMALPPYICLPRPIHNSGWGIEPVHSRKIELELNSTAVSREFVNQITCMEDVEKIRTPELTLDAAKEAQILEEAKVVFDGIIDFRMTGICMHLGVWDSIAMWMGVENCYYALMDEPEMIHALMEKMTVGLIDMIHQLNRMEAVDIHSGLCHCSHTHLNDLPGEDGRAVTENAWAFGLAQLFTSVSPAMTDEFEVQYMKRVFPYFGAIYYGCCDRLDDRMHVIEKLPKIRKLSCSPWSDREHFAEVMPSHCVMSAKPNPACLADGRLDEQLVREDLRRTMDAARAHGRNLELLLKDVSTVGHNPACLWRWHDIAMEEIQK